ncbi:MAG: hypothetical protein VX796_09150 [Pseudomonadota bacterium]|nr:hypothetical protein [Pseudomonadota bacterium]
MADTKRATYEVVVPFPHARGAWTKKGQQLALLKCEAAQLLRAGRIKPVASATAKATKATTAKTEG